jgi:hypothetical protein
MATVALIALIVFFICFRLLLPPVPQFFRKYSQRWGKLAFVVLCSVSVACAAVAIYISRH